MKSFILSIVLLGSLGFFAGCGENDLGENVEEAGEEVQEGVEEATE